MNSDTLQWLAEIQALQQQVMALQQERDEITATAHRWQKLYETEAQQRRSDAAAAQATIAQLQADLAAQSPLRDPDGGWVSPDLAEQQSQCDSFATPKAYRIQTLPEAQAELHTLRLTCANLQHQIAQLSHALAAEQVAHQQTRKTLTIALGDTIDLLTQERQKYNIPSATAPTPTLG